MTTQPETSPEPQSSSIGKRLRAVASSNRSERAQRWIDLLSAVLMAAATVATAWCGYQSSLWGGVQADHASLAMKAIVRAGESNNLAYQRTGVHVTLFGQWASATSTNNTALADFLLARLPEPLKTATNDWRALDPLNNPSAPPSPFDMPSYVLRERGEADRWEQTAADESDAAGRAGEIADQYLVYTIIFASVLFFAGISGKFSWQPVDIVVLVLGAMALLGGVIVMLMQPIAR
jgi:hypothetical protein